MASLVGGLFRVAFFLCALFLSLGAILAAFGFASPVLDAFNHLQPLWFVGTLLCLLLTGVFFRHQRSRALMIALSATGFLSSGVIVMPEIIAGFLARPATPAGAVSYRLMTYNIFGMNYDMDAVAAMVHAENPDILALNEYFPEQRATLHGLLVPDYPYFLICTGGKRANTAVYSRLAFTSAGREPCNENYDQRTSIIAARFAPEGGAPFILVATQLDWPVQISPLREQGDLLTRIDLMTARQRGEFARLGEQIDGIEEPLLVAGDFNSTPWSYCLKRFAQNKGLTRQTRDLPTFPKLWYFDEWRKTPAVLPLDHVMTRGGVLVTDLHTGPATGSDHLPVIADFVISP